MNERRKLDLIVFAVGLIPTIVTALIAPINVLTSVPLLNSYVSALSTVFPVIRGLSAVSSFPEVTGLVQAVAWTLMPLQVWILLRQRWFTFDDGKEAKRIVFRTIAVFVVFPATFVTFVYLWPITADDLGGTTLNARVLRTMSSSRIGLGAFTGLLLTGASWLIGLAIDWCRFLRERQK